MDGITLEILWSNLIGIVSEQAKALQRIAFSPIVREADGLAMSSRNAIREWRFRADRKTESTATGSKRWTTAPPR